MGNDFSKVVWINENLSVDLRPPIKRLMWLISLIYPFPGWHRWWMLLGLVIIIATGCANTSLIAAKTDSTDCDAKIHPEPQITEPKSTSSDSAIIEKKLRLEVRKWKGTPHQMGGTTRQGIDCSGFVQRLYRDIFGQQVPRSTELQVKSGQLIGIDQLRTGDLVFFRNAYKKRHVGIYLGQAEFAHASSSRGVTISSLQDHYWRQSYWTARRYLNAPH